jgi:hypothetical protein
MLSGGVGMGINLTGAFGESFNVGAQVVGANSNVSFDTPNKFVGVGPQVGPNFDTFTILIGGDYLFSYTVRGQPSGADDLVFRLMKNGSGVIGSSVFASAQGETLIRAVNGAGIIPLNVGDTVTLRNITAGGVDTVALGSTSQNIVNASLVLELLVQTSNEHFFPTPHPQ